MDQERDISEEQYNAHILHTGDGEVQYCEIETCPYYVLPNERTVTIDIGVSGCINIIQNEDVVHICPENLPVFTQELHFGIIRSIHKSNGAS